MLVGFLFIKLRTLFRLELGLGFSFTSSCCRVLRPKFDLSIPDLSELGSIEVGPWNPFETTYSLSYSTDAGKCGCRLKIFPQNDCFFIDRITEERINFSTKTNKLFIDWIAVLTFLNKVVFLLLPLWQCRCQSKHSGG